MTIYDITIAFVYLFEGVTLAHYLNALFCPRYKTNITVLIILMSYIIAYVSFILLDSILNSVVFTLTNFILCYGLYKVKIKDAVFHISIISVLLFGTEIFALYLCMGLFNPSSTYHDNTMTLTSIVIISKLLYFATLQIVIYIFNRIRNKDTKQVPASTVWYLWLAPLSTFLMYLVFLNLSLMIKLTPIINILICVLSVLFLFVNAIIFIAYKHNQNLQIDTLNAQLQLKKEIKDKEFYQMLSEQQEQQNLIIHDTKKHINTLKAYASQNSIDSITSYLYEIEKSPVYAPIMKLSDNNTLNLELTHFKQILDSKNIDSSFIVVPRSLEFMNPVDITSIVSNMLENALEATENTSDSFVEFSIIIDTSRNSTVIKMINTCKSDNLITEKNIFFTTKEDKAHHGYGLKSIEKSIAKYNGICEFYQSSDIFHSVLIIPNI